MKWQNLERFWKSYDDLHDTDWFVKDLWYNRPWLSFAKTTCCCFSNAGFNLISQTFLVTLLLSGCMCIQCKQRSVVGLLLFLKYIDDMPQITGEAMALSVCF